MLRYRDKSYLRPTHLCILLFVFSLLLLLTHRSNNRPLLNTRPPPDLEALRLSRLDPPRRRLLNSVLARIKSSYVYNRMPREDTPAFLVTYTCAQSPCGNLGDRLRGLVTAFFLALLNDKAAFSTVWIFPVHLDWYFEIDPNGVAMPSDRGLQYLDQASDAQKWTWHVPENVEYSFSSFSTTDFGAVWTSRKLRIISLRTTAVAWPALVSNPHLIRHIGEYTLDRLADSEMFFIVFSLLFARPTPWFERILEPYRDLLGGSTTPPSLASSSEPNLGHRTKAPWFRIGINIAESADDYKDLACMAAQTVFICQSVRKLSARPPPTCHVFVASSRPHLIARITSEILHRTRQIHIHSVNPADHPPADLDNLGADVVKSKPGWMGRSPEEVLKRRHARVFLEWTVLSRMDYLLGVKGDRVVETAAWAAQVRMEMLEIAGARGNGCSFVEYDGW